MDLEEELVADAGDAVEVLEMVDGAVEGADEGRGAADDEEGCCLVDADDGDGERTAAAEAVDDEELRATTSPLGVRARGG